MGIHLKDIEGLYEKYSSPTTLVNSIWYVPVKVIMMAWKMSIASTLEQTYWVIKGIHCAYSSYVFNCEKCAMPLHVNTLSPDLIRWPGRWVKPGLNFSHRLLVAVDYSFVTTADNYGCHHQLSSICPRALCKYKQSPNRMAKWSIQAIQIQTLIQIQLSILTCMYTEK